MGAIHLDIPRHCSLLSSDHDGVVAYSLIITFVFVSPARPTLDIFGMC